MPASPPKKYPDFDTLVKGAKEYEGLFKLYHKDDQVYAELRPTQFDQPFLCPIAIARGMAEGGHTRNFGPHEVVFTPGRIWASPATEVRYPVEWTIATPSGHYTVRARLDAQELDSRASTGAIYWEGLSDLFDPSGRRIGRGYLELTGYAAPLRLG